MLYKAKRGINKEGRGGLEGRRARGGRRVRSRERKGNPRGVCDCLNTFVISFCLFVFEAASWENLMPSENFDLSEKI